MLKRDVPMTLNEKAAIDALIATTRAEGAQIKPIGRFYLYLDNDAVIAAEEVMEGERETVAALDYETAQLLTLYREWKAEMTGEEWAALVKYNRETNSANANHLLAEFITNGDL